MSTGYTYEIKNGISFERYAWDCARAFGALIMMRDEPMGAPIKPDPYDDDHHSQALKESRAELARLESMSLADKQKGAEKANAENRAYFDRTQKERIDLLAKYNAMLAKAKGFIPPTEHHVALREFMISQIEESIRFDCLEPEPVVSLSAKEWHDKALKGAAWQVEYHTREGESDRKLKSERKQWVADLAKVVPIPDELKSTLTTTATGLREE